MRINFWLKAWREGNIGFHQDEVHPALIRHWPALEPGASVLVPLSGKSLDLLWLEQRGLEVTGIEFVESAVVDFFNENDLAWDERTQFGHRCFCARGLNIRIFVTDFIQFARDHDGPQFDSLYDRAALVALPHDMRSDYVAACKSLLPDSPAGILISMEYEPQTMEGPPFSVLREEVETLWAGQLALVETADMLVAMPRAIEAGVKRLQEYYWEFPVPV